MALTLVLGILMEVTLTFHSGKNQGLHGNNAPDNETEGMGREKRECKQFEAEDFPPKPFSTALRKLASEEDSIKDWQISGFPGVGNFLSQSLKNKTVPNGKSQTKETNLGRLSLISPPTLAILMLSSQLPRMLVQKFRTEWRRNMKMEVIFVLTLHYSNNVLQKGISTKTLKKITLFKTTAMLL
ncbi:hypothetical protein HPG69_002300 [Diceros bicornis minor]|uniref:Uncharacterized protein n=1 Tax=Diceros bicornis minor TaxID=77932 RepID=A0A7J7FCT8_DICBM|nr:hypothetical protein HPG69_002300 [Diceros bicornis minor]